MTLLLASTADSADSWAAELRSKDLRRPLQIWPEVPDPDSVEYAIVAKPPPGLLASLPNLKAILSLWAGVDHITSDATWPRHVPVYRMIEPGLTGGMVEFVLSQALNLHLGNYDVVAAQPRREWLRAPRGRYGMEPMVQDRTVGVLGLGEMGAASATALAAVGFEVIGWSRSPKRIDGVECLHGEDGFDTLIRHAEILVNLLPLTAETENILARDVFQRMPEGAGLVNVGRGQHVVDDDLLAALDAGRLGRAVLDVFREEPLPVDHPFWTHPNITIYPHIASVTRVRTGVDALLRSIAMLEAGETPEARFDVDRGY
jgi:glyoxylate/hydroxypyruvate reductase A